MTDQEERQSADTVRPHHTVRRSSGCGQTFFDRNGHPQQTGRYLVRVWCDCGWTGMDDVENISAVWADHSDGDVS